MSDRRAFLKTSVGVASGVVAGGYEQQEQVLAASAVASERICLGVIGIGPRAKYVLGGMLKHKDVQCVAIADVQQTRRDAGKKLVDNVYGDAACETLGDFRQLLDRKDIDAVFIATGDRWHATASMLAAEAGKDVYSEKPCGITIDLCKQLAETIDRTGRVFQAGTQRRSVANFVEAVRLVHDGVLGDLKSLHATVYVPEIKTQWLPGQPTPNPKQCDWNLWLGPAPWRPYHQDYVNGRWRGYYDFDSGARLLDWGAHTVDLCQWAHHADDTVPVQYAADEKGVTATYADGTPLRIDFLQTPFGQRPGWIQSLGTCPVRFVGSKGTVEVGDSGGIVVSPEKLMSAVKPLPQKGSGLDVEAHSRNFFDCIKSRELPVANQNAMRQSHIACHAAAIAWMLGRTVKLDPKTLQFLDDDEANRLCARPERNWQ